MLRIKKVEKIKNDYNLRKNLRGKRFIAEFCRYELGWQATYKL